jgi:GT2 family glycosyltransferase
VTFDRPDALRESLEVLTRQTRRLDVLIVIDNAPSAAVEEVVRRSAAAHRIEYLPSATNVGPAGGIALGMEHCLRGAVHDDWLCVLDDDDALVADDLLERHLGIATAADDRVAGVGGGGAVFDWATGRLRGVHTGAPGNPVPADYLKSGWCPLYRLDAIRDVGVFDPAHFFGFDDLEFGLRLRRAGWELLVCDSVAGGGHAAGPAWRVGPLDWRRYYSLRNLVYLLRSHGRVATAARVSLISGLAKPLVNLAIEPTLAARHLALNARALRDGWTGRLGRTVEPASDRRLGK